LPKRGGGGEKDPGDVKRERRGRSTTTRAPKKKDGEDDATPLHAAEEIGEGLEAEVGPDFFVHGLRTGGGKALERERKRKINNKYAQESRIDLRTTRRESKKDW